MPGATHTEKLYGLPGPQNSAVLMDIISKLKHDLQQSKAENGKLVDQLNCLISLVKRAWSGEQGAILHLANIVGMEPPAMSESDMNRNTPIPDKTRAVKNWERLAIRLLEREYRAIQQEIQEKQRLYLQNRQMFMNDVMVDHNREMSKLSLHKNSEIDEVDKKFLRCFSAKTRQEKKAPNYRPHSAYKAAPRTAGDMVERADMRVGDIIGQQTGVGGPGGPETHGQSVANKAFTGLYKMNSHERLLYRPKEKFDDPSRYRKTNLFDPDVIFSPEMLVNPREEKERPFSAKSAMRSQSDSRMGQKTRPKSAVFLTEGKPERPLRYETTRPISGKPRSATKTNLRQRRHSASNADRKPPISNINRKELHNRSELGPSHSQYEIGEQTGYHDENGSGDHDVEPIKLDDSGHMTSEEEEDVELAPRMKTPMAVKIRRNDPVDKFVDELKLMQEMELDFKNSAVQLQKKLGVDSNGFVF